MDLNQKFSVALYLEDLKFLNHCDTTNFMGLTVSSYLMSKLFMYFHEIFSMGKSWNKFELIQVLAIILKKCYHKITFKFVILWCFSDASRLWGYGNCDAIFCHHMSVIIVVICCKNCFSVMTCQWSIVGPSGWLSVTTHYYFRN